MAVRRLAPKELQPANFALSEDTLAWAKTQIAKYPEGRQASAVIPILWRVQEQHDNWLSEAAIRTVADLLDMPYIRVLEVATFYTQFQLQPVGKKAHIQVCGTTPCQLRGSDEIIALCKHRIHHDPFHISDDGNFSWEEVECLGACVNAPMVLIWSDTYEDLTKENFGKVLDGFAAGNPPKPGPQDGRQFSAPAGGPTTLKSMEKK
jgi:NADH-quinone oxidoreductase subunit E